MRVGRMGRRARRREFDPHETALAWKRRVVQVRYTGVGDCAICLDPMRGRPVTVEPCGHALHLKCEQRLRQSRCPTRRTCPMCREPILAEESCDELSCDDLDELVGSFTPRTPVRYDDWPMENLLIDDFDFEEMILSLLD